MESNERNERQDHLAATTHAQASSKWLAVAVTLPRNSLGAALLYATGLIARAGEVAAAGFSLAGWLLAEAITG